MPSNEPAMSLPQLGADQNKGKSAKEKVRNTLTDELVIGICAPIGSLREAVINELSAILKKEYGYDVQILKLSEYISKHTSIKKEIKPGETAPYTYLMSKIGGGDKLRKEFGPSVLTELAIHDIHVSRHQDKTGKLQFQKIEQLKSRRKCFIIDSLKNKEELELLRDLYNDIFYFFSVFSPLSEREKNLTDKGLSKDEVKLIIDTDNFENNDHGQNVKDTFIEADFFVRVSKDNIDELNNKINRYLNIIFESDIVTPMPNEIAMYQAKSAAGNSACLSRQVGASITNEKGEIISRGWNDVPKFGGNLYKEGDINDSRCKLNGYCSNDKTKDMITDEILKGIFQDDYLIKNLFGNKKIEPSTEEYKTIKKVIRKNSRIRDLIEFSRAVHAEMHAIIIGSQLGGSKMIGGKLFCTTYPCHNCARHIIVSGIKEIYYIEPYSKSLSLVLHNDAITEDETSTDKVRLLVYDGVAPRRFMEFFLMKRPRKDADGKVNLEFKDLFNPKSRLSLQALPTLEQQAIHSLYEKGILKDD
jgi:deoxycytidylate deaminase